MKPSEYGRKEAFQVHQALKKRGPVTVPREFVFMDRAAIGLGAVFLHLAAELNFYRLFNEAIERFSIEQVAARQAAALAEVGPQAVRTADDVGRGVDPDQNHAGLGCYGRRLFRHELFNRSEDRNRCSR